MEIHAPFLGNLLDYASSQKIDIGALRSLMKNPDTDLNDSDKMVAAEDYVLIFENIIEKITTNSSGLNIGAYFNLRSLGIVREISLSTSSLKQGIYILDKYLKNKFPIVSFSIVEDSDSYTLKFESSVISKKVKKELLNMVLYIVYRELKLMLPNEHIPQIKFPFLKTKNINLYFKENVKYSSDHLIILPRNIDELEINLNSVKEIELLLPKFISMLNHNDHCSEAFSKSVRNMLLNLCDPEIPNFKQVQKQFAFSERSFQRRLTKEGTSFRQISNEVKEELSYYLSNEKHLKTKDIAFILGYSDSSAYLHALQSWKIKYTK